MTTGQSAAPHNPLAAYGVVTGAYWSFMLSDGALRMLVLLHFHEQGFTPIQLSYLFVLYELAGIITNFTAGWLAARFGLTRTLYAGLLLQVIALLALGLVESGASGGAEAQVIGSSVVFVMVVQGLSGVAKDLTKMSSKSAVKILAPQGQGALFRWVAILTGSKNAIKGFGFFLGAALLAQFEFRPTLWIMAAGLSIVLITALIWMPAGLSVGKRGVKLTSAISKDPNVNWLSAARVFLFGARDVLFVVAVPISFYGFLSDGTPAANKAAFFQIGIFMAGWVVFYGLVQALAPRILGGKRQCSEAIVRKLAIVGLMVAAVPVILAAVLYNGILEQHAVWVLGLGLWGFAAIFALNSALHSYLILAFSNASRVSLDVGFYYMANATGRLLGTLASGFCFPLWGLQGCLLVSAAMLALAAILSQRLKSGALEVQKSA